MPLKKGSSPATRKHNIREMIRSGKAPRVAVAAAYRQQRSAAAKKGHATRRRKK